MNDYTLQRNSFLFRRLFNIAYIGAVYNRYRLRLLINLAFGVPYHFAGQTGNGDGGHHGNQLFAGVFGRGFTGDTRLLAVWSSIFIFIVKCEKTPVLAASVIPILEQLKPTAFTALRLHVDTTVPTTKIVPASVTIHTGCIHTLLSFLAFSLSYSSSAPCVPYLVF